MSETPDPLSPAELVVADSLQHRRPVAGRPFLVRLRQRVRELDPGWGPRPPRLRWLIYTRLGVGAVLIALGALIGLGVF